MNLWLTAAVGLLPALAAAGWLAAVADLENRLVALELGTTLAVFMLILLSVGYDQPSFIDLCLTLVLLSFPGALAYAHFWNAGYEPPDMSAGELAEIVLVALGVAASWLAAFGLLRLPDAFARLHCVSFAGTAGGFCFTAAVLIDRGGDPLGFKTVTTIILLLLTGAVFVHATGRALRLRHETGDHSG